MIKASHRKIRDLQDAHRKLMQEYVASIDSGSRLPFFVNPSRILVPYDKETAFERINRQLYFLFTPFIWRPFVVLLMELHIKSKMNELVTAYRQLALQLPDGKQFNQQREWLKLAIVECNELSTTLSTWKNTQALSVAILPVLLGWVTSVLGVNSISNLLPKLGIQSITVWFVSNIRLLSFVLYWIFFSSGTLGGLLWLAFQGKRSLFLPVAALKKVTVPTRNVYLTETTLFDLIGRQKMPELAIDIIIVNLFVGLGLVMTFLFLLLVTSTAGVTAIISILLMLALTMGLMIISSAWRWN